MIENEAFWQRQFELPPEIAIMLEQENYDLLDQSLGFLLEKGGLLYQSISRFIKIENLEYLIAIRQGPDDEDGIWHDDGTRELAFTLSLTREPELLIGGNLLMRKKNHPQEIITIPTADYGVLTFIKTGRDGFEHRVQRVEKGKRIICAGWINRG